MNGTETIKDLVDEVKLSVKELSLKAKCWDIAMAKGWRVVADVKIHKNYCDYIEYIKNYDKKLFNSEYRLTEEEFELLKEGSIPKPKRIIYRATCKYCKCEFEFETEDCIYAEKCINGNMVVDCPCCKNHVNCLHDTLSYREEEQ